MNDAMMKEQARERLLSAELAEVLEVELAATDEPPAAAPPRRWLAAAVLLLGVAVAGGVAWLRAHDVHEVQQREFDPTDPWWEHEWPSRAPHDVILTPEQAVGVPADHTFLTTSCGELGLDGLYATLGRQCITGLHLSFGQAGTPSFPMAQLLAHEELETLALHGRSRFGPAELRELRRLPALRSLSFGSGDLRLDAETGAALAELTKLRHLTLFSGHILPEGVAALGGLQDLETVYLSSSVQASYLQGQPRTCDTAAVLEAVAGLRQVRALRLHLPEPADAASLRRLRTLPRLVALELSGSIDDAGLAALPRGLQHLQLGDVTDVSSQGMQDLRDLRELSSLALPWDTAAQVHVAWRALLSQLHLEAFSVLGGLPDAELWHCVQRLPRLRRLAVYVGRDVPIQGVFGEVGRCPSLELFLASVPDVPTPDQIAVLRGHPSLKRVRLIRYRPSSRLPTEAELNDLRTAAGCEVEVR